MAAKRKPTLDDAPISAEEWATRQATAACAPVEVAPDEVRLMSIRDLADLVAEAGIEQPYVDALIRDGLENQAVIDLIRPFVKDRRDIAWDHNAAITMVIDRRTKLHEAEPLTFEPEGARGIGTYRYDEDENLVPPTIGTQVLIDRWDATPETFAVEQVAWFGRGLMVRGVTTRADDPRARRSNHRWSAMYLTTPAKLARKQLERRLDDQLDGVGIVVRSIAKELVEADPTLAPAEAVGQAIGRIVAKVAAGSELQYSEIAAEIMRAIA